MKKNFETFNRGILLMMVFFLIHTGCLNAQQVLTDKPEYSPGESVLITGSGFHAGDSITLEIHHLEPNLPNPEHEHSAWSVLSDLKGDFSSTWFVEDREANTTLELRAADKSGNSASIIFKDAGDQLNLVNNNVINARNVCAASTDNVIHSFKIRGTGWSGAIQKVTFNNSGTYLSGEILNFRLYVTTSGVFSKDHLLSTIEAPLFRLLHEFPPFNFYIGSGSYYFWIVMDVASTVVSGHYIKVLASASSNISANVPVIRGDFGDYIGRQTLRSLPSATISGDAILPPDSSANLLINMTGTAPWSVTYSDGTTAYPLSNVFNNPLTITVTPSSSKIYTLTSLSDMYCRGTEMAGSASIVVNNAPVIESQPATTSVAYGETASFTIGASGNSLTYVWQTSTDQGTNWMDLPDSNTPTLFLSRPEVRMNNYQYRCKITDEYNQQTVSDVAVLRVQPKLINIFPVPDQSKIYGSQDPVFSYTVAIDDLEEGDSFKGVLGRDPGENVLESPFNYTLGSLTAGPNYILSIDNENSFTIHPRSLTIQADSKSKIYGDPDPELTATVSGGSIVNSDKPSGLLKRESGENAGIYQITAGSYTYGSNYQENFASAEFLIKKRPITIQAETQTKTYGESDPELTARIVESNDSAVPSVSATPVPDNPTGFLLREEGEDVGIYNIIKGSYTYGSNYEETFIGSELQIQKRPLTIEADPKSKIYGDSDPVLTARVISGQIVGGDLPSGKLIRTAGEDAGSYSIDKGDYSFGSNYEEIFIGSEFLIGKRQITIEADGKSKIYGDSDPVLTARVSAGSIIGTDQPSGGLIRTPGENAGSYPISKGNYTYGSNYEETWFGADLIIEKRSIDVLANAQSKFCGEEDPELSYITSGKIYNDDGFDIKLCREPGECPGSYAIKMESAGPDENYTWTYTGSSLTIKNFINLEVNQSSSANQINTPALLSAKVTPAIPGIPVKFLLDNGLCLSGSTDNDGVATVSYVGSSPEVYKVTASIKECIFSSDVAYIAFYDPYGGFITGGGWINSPVGALVGTDLSGKANFGFNSKYEKGKSTPSGNTEFQFKAGNLNFSSSEYFLGSLVISGYKATYKGVGVIAGRQENYNFLVSAIDGKITGSNGYDKFRIKIWNSSGVIYDNNIDNKDDNALPATALSGGSIVIHAADNKKSAELRTERPEIKNPESNTLIANGFSPNGDGINDYFKIKGIEKYPDAVLNIYSRDGKLLYQQEHYGNTDFWGFQDAWWDGRMGAVQSIHSAKLSSGSYIYVLDLERGKRDFLKRGVLFINR